MTLVTSMGSQPHRPLRGNASAGRWLFSVLLMAAFLAGCASSKHRAPVEDRSVFNRAAVPSPAPTAAPATLAQPSEPGKVPMGSEDAGKPGFYMVKPGDTLIRIGLESGQSWKDIIRWNNLENPNVIEVGQVLRVVPPGADPNAVATRPVASSRIESRPLDAPRPPAAASTPTPPPVVASIPPAQLPSPSPAPATRESGDDELNWLWPAAGAVVVPFDEARSKGLSIAGKAGDPVMAAADGRVVYAGSGLRGYGNLVILKHNNTYLTAYAHNQALLVKEEQSVKRGQKIAEMGATDADRIKLHFEIRKLGKPIDPAKVLPPR